MLTQLPDTYRIGVGVVDQKTSRIESADEIIPRIEKAIDLFGASRVLLNPDCGFATFADNPIASADVAEKQLHSLVTAARTFHR